jgi:hypothetical protein
MIPSTAYAGRASPGQMYDKSFLPISHWQVGTQDEIDNQDGDQDDDNDPDNDNDNNHDNDNHGSHRDDNDLDDDNNQDNDNHRDDNNLDNDNNDNNLDNDNNDNNLDNNNNDNNLDNNNNDNNLDNNEANYHISGKILLQGRDNHQGVKIFASQEACTINATQEEIVVTDQEGYFEVMLSTQYHCLQAAYPGYLSDKQDISYYELSTTATTNEPVILLGGDVTGDGQIDIMDLAKIGGRYGEYDEILDLNGNGKVDIFDITIAAGNFH